MTYPYKTGDKGKTRGGHDYEVNKDDLKRSDGRNLVVVITDKDGDQSAHVATADGRFLNHSDSEYDLLPPTRKVYVNFYPAGSAAWCSTRAVAEAAYSRDCIAVAVEVEIPCEQAR